jgi:hypothetical protein
VIIDNKSDNYSSHIHNGIPIREYNGEESDETLMFLRDYLMDKILCETDVRDAIRADFFQ